MILTCQLPFNIILESLKPFLSDFYNRFWQHFALNQGSQRINFCDALGTSFLSLDEINGRARIFYCV
ncbi:MAG: hypothetical protein BRC36_04895 [Cyanobacteria bacterium QH_2_48_84]|nr:MAG: hypothetical protein BRC36_04895 [Cyanobacteria bacterium QH_2_48_84]